MGLDTCTYSGLYFCTLCYSLKLKWIYLGFYVMKLHKTSHNAHNHSLDTPQSCGELYEIPFRVSANMRKKNLCSDENKSEVWEPQSAPCPEWSILRGKHGGGSIMLVSTLVLLVVSLTEWGCAIFFTFYSNSFNAALWDVKSFEFLKNKPNPNLDFSRASPRLVLFTPWSSWSCVFGDSWGRGGCKYLCNFFWC